MNSRDYEDGEAAGTEAAGADETASDVEATGADEAAGTHETGGTEQAADSGEAHDAVDAAEAETADSNGETAAPPRDAELDRLAEVGAERDRLRDRHLRLAADFDNYRRRTEDRLRQRWDRAQADLVSRLLDPLDDLLRVTALEPETKSSVDSIVEGVDLVERKFFRVLGDAGVEIVDPGGEPFDPNVMEAMMRVPTESEEDDDTVAQVFQKGYTLRGLLIRPARVSVFKR